MPVQLLDEKLISRLHGFEVENHLEIFDTQLKGFFVDVLASGRLVYRVRYRVQGRQRVSTIGDARLWTLDEARTAARGILRIAMQGGDPKLEGPNGAGQGGLTVQAFFSQHYLPYVQTYKRSWGTDHSVLNNQIFPAIGHIGLAQLGAGDVTQLILGMRSKAYAEGTVNRVLVLLRYGYSLAMRWQVGGISKNPMDGVKPLKVDNKIERYLSDGDMARLVAAVRSSPNPMLQHIVGFLIFTGARKREVLDARWADIDFATKLWRIPKTKAGKPRHVPLSGEALALLAQVQQLHQQHFGFASVQGYGAGNPFIFPNLDTGKPFRSVFYSWHTARTQAGLPEFRMHDLRHSFASFLVNAGRSLYEVQLLLGHADIRTTSRYAHLDQKRLFDAVEVIKGVVGSAE